MGGIRGEVGGCSGGRRVTPEMGRVGVGVGEIGPIGPEGTGASESIRISTCMLPPRAPMPRPRRITFPSPVDDVGEVGVGDVVAVDWGGITTRSRAPLGKSGRGGGWVVGRGEDGGDLTAGEGEGVSLLVGRVVVAVVGVGGAGS